MTSSNCPSIYISVRSLYKDILKLSFYLYFNMSSYMTPSNCPLSTFQSVLYNITSSNCPSINISTRSLQHDIFKLSSYLHFNVSSYMTFSNCPSIYISTCPHTWHFQIVLFQHFNMSSNMTSLPCPSILLYPSIPFILPLTLYLSPK